MVRKIGSLLLVLILLCGTLCGCEPKKAFDSEQDMKDFIEGVWYDQASETYYIIDSRGCREYCSALGISAYTGDEILEESFYDFYSRALAPQSITYDYSRSEITTGKGVIFSVLGDGHLKKDDGTILEKSNYQKSDMMDLISDEYTAAKEKYKEEYYAELKKQEFEEKYEGLPTATEVKYNKFGYLGRSFKISGSVQLDDYYNWGYDNLEPLYFCMRVRPTGGSYSDEWYIYADRNKFADLYQSLLGSSKSVTLICELWYYDTGTNDMATLVDYQG